MDERVVEAVRMIQHTKMPTIGRYFHAIADHDELTSLAHFVDVPTHVLVGTRDRLTPVAWGRRLAEQIPGARFTEFPGLGHMLPYEATDAVTSSLLEHLTSSAPGARAESRSSRRSRGEAEPRG